MCPLVGECYARRCSARFLAPWTAADQRVEQGSCTLLNINAGENKCDPLLSSPAPSLSLSLPGILLPALPAASALNNLRVAAAELEEPQSRTPGPPTNPCFSLHITPPVVTLFSGRRNERKSESNRADTQISKRVTS